MSFNKEEDQSRLCCPVDPFFRRELQYNSIPLSSCRHSSYALANNLSSGTSFLHLCQVYIRAIGSIKFRLQWFNPLSYNPKVLIFPNILYTVYFRVSSRNLLNIIEHKKQIYNIKRVLVAADLKPTSTFIY
jgi:hypothetical protein